MNAPKLPKRLDYNQLLETLRSWSKNNRAEVLLSIEVGCYYCTNMFPAGEVKKYEQDNTAICPKCSINSVIADYTYPVTVEVLKEMYKYWFEGGTAYKMKDGKPVDVIDLDDKYDKVEFAEYRDKQLAFDEYRRQQKKLKKV